jgi:hypothetical protein
VPAGGTLVCAATGSASSKPSAQNSSRIGIVNSPC